MKFIIWALALNWIYPQFYRFQFSRWSRRLDKSQKYQRFSNHNIQFMKAPKNLSPESKTVSSTRLLDLSNKSVNNGVAVNFTLSQKTFDESFILIKNTVNSCCSLLFHLCQETFTKIWPFLQDFFNGLKQLSNIPAKNSNNNLGVTSFHLIEVSLNGATFQSCGNNIDSVRFQLLQKTGSHGEWTSAE